MKTVKVSLLGHQFSSCTDCAIYSCFIQLDIFLGTGLMVQRFTSTRTFQIFEGRKSCKPSGWHLQGPFPIPGSAILENGSWLHRTDYRSNSLCSYRVQSSM